jgi:hypothetical protein
MTVEERVRLMTDNGDVEGLQQMAHHPDKALAKAARKGLHILRTRGHDAPVPRRPEAGSRRMGIGVSADYYMDPSLASGALGVMADLPALLRRRRRRVTKAEE